MCVAGGMRSGPGALGRQRIEPIGRQRVEPFCDHRLRRPRLGGGQPALQDLVLGLQDLDGGFKDIQTRHIVGHGARR